MDDSFGNGTAPFRRSHTDSPAEPESVHRTVLTSNMVSSFRVAQVHRHHQKPVSSLDFARNGQLLVSTSADNHVGVYDCTNGQMKKIMPVKKYGAGIVRFIKDDRPATVITASTATDHKIRALDLEDGSYVRYFAGHDSQVISIAASPAGPSFISSSQDSFVRMWDSRNEVASGRLRTVGCPLVAYDPKGLIFGLVYNSHGLKTMVKLYDARQYEEGPFLEFELDNRSDSLPTCFKFSSDGEYFLVVNADVNATVSVYDAYKGAHFRTFAGHKNTTGIPLEASFSPDSAYVSSGSDDGSLYLWGLQSGKLLMERSQVHVMPSTCSIWNPVYGLIASACQNISLWLPQEDTAPSEY